jgi:isoquinoline 1-oxidoreductase beta subunit
MKENSPLSRRDFLKVSSIAGLGLVIGLTIPGCSNQRSTSEILQETYTSEPEASFTPNVFVTLDTDGSVTITCPRPDMGQGTRTALAMIVAEELGVDWSSVRIVQADADIRYGNQQAGGSTSIEQYYTPLRQAGALVKKMMVYAAAAKWGISPSECSVHNSEVTNQQTGEAFHFRELVRPAMSYDPDDYLPVDLKDPADFSIIGTSAPRVDGLDMTTGKALYGMDVRMPGKLFAAVAHCPVFGGKLVSFDDSQARAIPGVSDVLEINCGMNGGIKTRGVAVVARDTWSAIRGRNALKVTWDEGSKANLNSADIEQSLIEQVTSPSEEGELVAYYTVPYFSHSPMEPINSTVWVGPQKCEVWAPTQSPQELQWFINRTYKVPLENIHLHVPLIGGGFGRRLEFHSNNLVLPAFHLMETYELSSAAGVPIQVVWTREDDMHFEYYHPMSITRVSAQLDDINSLKSRRVEGIGFGIPTGALRAVSNIPDAFAHESFIDEFAVATNQDSIELRRKMLNDRERAVLDLLVERSGWGSALPPGHGRGIAIHSTWGVSPCAQAVEVMVDASGRVHALRVVCAIDCGVVVNPDMVTAQMEGGILFGLTSTLKAQITISNGRVVQSNFHDYPLLQMNEAPKIEVYIVKSKANPTGVGEMANPPIAAAVANAVYAATGKRVRRLPIDKLSLTDA